jgi:hypothetical protein
MAAVAREQNILLMMFDSCAVQRGLADGGHWPEKARPKGTVVGVEVGCFPDFYEALEFNPPDHIVTL